MTKGVRLEEYLDEMWSEDSFIQEPVLIHDL